MFAIVQLLLPAAQAGFRLFQVALLFFKQRSLFIEPQAEVSRLLVNFAQGDIHRCLALIEVLLALQQVMRQLPGLGVHLLVHRVGCQFAAAGFLAGRLVGSWRRLAVVRRGEHVRGIDADLRQ